jgi:4-amino-4-deoxy-L-arabinose transferase-like glycosyltransferase
MIYTERIQHLIHALEVGRFSRWLQLLPLALAVIGLAVVYDLVSYRGFNSPEAMDAAQVARNLAEGKGYTTDFIRPFSVFLVSKHNHDQHIGELLLTNAVDFAELDGGHPDLANPPVYPIVLAGLMKVWPPDWKVRTREPFWSEGGRFMRYQPEFQVAIFNQALLLAVAALTFLLTLKLFGAPAAWLTAILTLGADLLWKFSVSGQSTLLLLVVFLGLVWCLMKIEELGRGEQPSVRKLFLLAVAAGVLAGAGMLTRYSFGWVIVPVVVFLALFGGVRRPGLAVAAFLAFALAVTPWIIRNLAVSGTLFGTAGYAVVEGTFAFPGSRLMQSVNPDLASAYNPDLASAYWVRPYLGKFLVNARYILQGDLLRIGGSWVAVLFFAGLLLGLRNVAARRMRYFTMMCLGVFIVAQALGKTQLSAISPDVNSENLLVLLTPFVVVFGVAFFLTLLNQMNTLSPEARLGVVVLMVAVSCQTFIGNLLPPKTSPVAYPPYYPPEIQKISGWMRPDELMMSDIPWAVAWYGGHQCVWTTANSQYEFFEFNDYVKDVRGLYLTLNTLDGKLFTECLQGDVDSWYGFVFERLAPEKIVRLESAADTWGRIAINNGFDKQTALKAARQFPLNYAPYGLLSGLFLTDRQRWETE